MESMVSPEMLESARLDFGDVVSSERGDDDEEGIETPPFSMEVAAVEIADVEDPDAAHIEVKSGAALRKQKHVLSSPF